MTGSMSVWSIYNKTSIFSYDIKSLKNVSIYINVYEHVNILIKYTFSNYFTSRKKLGNFSFPTPRLYKYTFVKAEKKFWKNVINFYM